MRIAAICLVLSLGGTACSNSKSSGSAAEPATPAAAPTAPAVDPAPAPTVEAPPAPTPGAAPVAMAPPSPQELYASCEDRLELPETAGECSSDDQCAPAGCSSERCVTKASAADLMSTCEMLPCFEVVEACSCVQGACRWSVKAEVSPKPMIQLPQ